VRPAATAAVTVLTLACFAANSLLARAALGRGHADAATFTLVRLASGAVALPLLLAAARRRPRGGSWASAAALVAYAAAFSLAYLHVEAGPGALLLFAAVQATMLGWSVARGARPTRLQWIGVALALAGLAALTLPGAHAPDLAGALLMIAAGAAWGVYSIRGRSATDPVATTAANFARGAALAVPLAAALALGEGRVHATPDGLLLAAVSGALASGGGYCLWYLALPALGTTRAAVVQLAVPAATALSAVALLGEALTARVALSAAAILGGIALTVRPAPPSPARTEVRAA
jgi:drug/metabolite transporter (DMT)-like permease